MARPRLYSTEEERRDAKQASWQKYNKAHKAERAAHNKEYVQKDNVKARRSQLRAQSSLGRVHTIDTIDTINVRAPTLIILEREPA